MSAQDLKKKKYLFIMENVAENGYDTTKFNAFLREKFVCKSRSPIDPFSSKCWH